MHENLVKDRQFNELLSESQKAVPTTVNKEVIAETIVESSTEVPVVREKAVPVYERQEVPV